MIPEIEYFFEGIKGDNRIYPAHISVYMAIVQCWIQNGCHNPVIIKGKHLMLLAKISGLATYHRVIKDLDRFGYIRYMPSNDCFAGSLVDVLSEADK